MSSLSWTLAIATYRRPDMLLRCLRLAAEQSRPPLEVVVVDASPEWEASRDAVMAELATAHPAIEWRYHEAERASAAHQRNACVRLARGDVLFLIDDDSLMYPDCAERILAVYEADQDERIAGVAAALAARPPDEPGAPEGPAEAPAPHSGPVAWLRGLLRADDLFVPYDERFPEHPMPAEVAHLGLGQRRTMAGMTMTIRRSVALREPFETALQRVSAGEDSDMSYRASRHGKLVTAFDARLHHVGSTAARLSPFVVAALGALNPIVLHGLHSTDLERSARRTRALLRRRVLIEAAKDLRARDWSLPRARGIWLALRELSRVLAMPSDSLRDWYPGHQRELIARYSSD